MPKEQDTKVEKSHSRPMNFEVIVAGFEKMGTFVPCVGLGLSIFMLPVDRMGGEISVESLFRERSKFRIWMPCEVEVKGDITCLSLQ